MKKLLVLSLALISSSVFAEMKQDFRTEVICDTKDTTWGDFIERPAGDEINTRIKKLEGEGKSVLITHLSTSTAGSSPSKSYQHFEEKFGGFLEKVCVVIQYTDAK